MPAPPGHAHSCSHRHCTRCKPSTRNISLLQHQQHQQLQQRCHVHAVRLQSTGASDTRCPIPIAMKGDRQEGSGPLASSDLDPTSPDRQTLRPLLQPQAATPDDLLTCLVGSMANNGPAEAFARLSSSDSRRSALQALIKELTPYEWRFVQLLTSSRTFQFDIIGQLPVELVSQIFSYLDTSTPWRLQHVG